MIDPIVVREQREILIKRSEAQAAGIKAADAILWFVDHAKGQPANKVFGTRVEIAASATTNVDLARKYLLESAQSFADDILDRALEMAMLDFDNAKRVGKVEDDQPRD